MEPVCSEGDIEQSGNHCEKHDEKGATFFHSLHNALAQLHWSGCLRSSFRRTWGNMKNISFSSILERNREDKASKEEIVHVGMPH